MASILNTQELREFQEFSKNIALLAKNIQKNTESNNKQKQVELDKITAINKLSDVIKSSTDKITSSIDSLITEIKK